MSMYKILIDGDILVYRAGFAVGDGPLSHALQATKMMLNNIHNKMTDGNAQWDAYERKIYLTSEDKSNYRYDKAVTKPYKGNRSADKPQHYSEIRSYLVDQYHAEVVYGMEADDVLSIEACKDLEYSVIVTLDKDLDQTPGYHYNFVKDKFYVISRREAYENFCRAMLVGDPVDNIPGFEGVGPVKAKQAMKICKGDKTKMINLVYDLYTTKYDEDYFMEQGHLLWIRRKENEGWDPDLKSLRAGKLDLDMAGVLDWKKRWENNSLKPDTPSVTRT